MPTRSAHSRKHRSLYAVLTYERACPRVRVRHVFTDSCSPSVPRTVCDSVNRRRHRLQTHIVVPRYESASIVADDRSRFGHDFSVRVAVTMPNAITYLYDSLV